MANPILEFVQGTSQLIAKCWKWCFAPKTPRFISQHLEQYLGEAYLKLETHEKQFPGYDVASLHQGLTTLLADACTDFREVGSCHLSSMKQIFDFFQQVSRWLPIAAPAFERVPIDVEEEVSVTTRCLYVCTLKPEAGRRRQKLSASLKAQETQPTAPPELEKLAVFVCVHTTGHECWDSMETSRVPHMQVLVSIACRSREVADRFFAELEERRRAHNVYQGKVIDPVFAGGTIQTIGFRAIKRVAEEDLILPEEVRAQLLNAIVGFYRHRSTLQALGIELKRGILLHGPPGTGKTSISLYLAGLLPHFTVCFVSGERLLFPREICRMARYLQPTMVVFEDVDLVAFNRESNGLATVLGELMNQIDGCEPTDEVLFVMTTNSLDRLESAVRNRPGRVDQIIEIPLPSRECRSRLLQRFTQTVPLRLESLERVLQVTRDMTPAMLKEIVKRATVQAIERRQDQAASTQIDLEQLALTETDLLLAAEQVRHMRSPEVYPSNFGFQGDKATG